MPPTKLIRLADGTLMEVSVDPNEAQPIAGGLAEKVEATFDKVQPLLLNTCRPIIEVWRNLRQDVHVDQMEIELGLSFEGEGNLYITRTKGSANLSVKLVITSEG